MSHKPTWRSLVLAVQNSSNFLFTVQRELLLSIASCFPVQFSPFSYALCFILFRSFFHKLYLSRTLSGIFIYDRIYTATTGYGCVPSAPPAHGSGKIKSHTIFTTAPDGNSCILHKRVPLFITAHCVRCGGGSTLSFASTLRNESVDLITKSGRERESTKCRIFLKG